MSKPGYPNKLPMPSVVQLPNHSYAIWKKWFRKKDKGAVMDEVGKFCESMGFKLCDVDTRRAGNQDDRIKKGKLK